MTHRLLTGLAAGFLLVPLVTPPAAAVPPDNDSPAGAVRLRLDERVVQDTREATTDDQDGRLNSFCGAPATGASVWYTVHARRDRDMVVDLRRSDYSVGAMVFRGEPRPRTLVNCGPERVAFHARAGTTYSVMIFNDTRDQGGRLVATLKVAPKPRIELSVARRGLAYRNGDARVRGSYRCRGEGAGFLFGSLEQRAGRLKIPSAFGTRIRCDGRRHTWSVRAVSEIGLYAPGRARVVVEAQGCGLASCTTEKARRTVRLVRAGGSSVRSQAPPPVERPRLSTTRAWPR